MYVCMGRLSNAKYEVMCLKFSAEKFPCKLITRRNRTTLQLRPQQLTVM